MSKLKSIFLVLGLGICFNSFSQNLSPESIRKLQIDTYEKCLSDAQKVETDIDKINKYIISCMEKNGFLTKDAYQQQKEELNLYSSSNSLNNNLDFNEFSKKIIKENQDCINKYKTENEILNCINK